ncbi:MAG: LarC family nickel insertion protein [Deltaproteobacteria bacterium]|nr:LarC family nickel insertion protein [Deltaproteobacteria bacterium]
MFAGAVLDAWPELGEGLVPALRSAGLCDDVTVRWQRVTDETLAGTRFLVDDPRERGRAVPPSNLVLQPSAGAHAHVPYRDVRARIAASTLEQGVRERALDIFALLAGAEAAVHGIERVDDVELHEVGAQDAIADVVTAAWLVHHAGVASTSTSPVPLGSGRIEAAHGLLPIPAPAAAHLLRGFATFDDGRKGERVTPTGCAILKHLAPRPTAPPGVLGAAGIGWGSRRFPGLPNVLRVLELTVGDAPTLEGGALRERVVVLTCEIDDQTPEDLAVALDHLRAHEGVLDVSQSSAIGKKGRLAVAVQLLVRVGAEQAVARAVLSETTTLGVRLASAERLVLEREQILRDGVRAKRALRPDGSVSVKAESDDLADLRTAGARARRRRAVEHE